MGGVLCKRYPQSISKRYDRSERCGTIPEKIFVQYADGKYGVGSVMIYLDIAATLIAKTA